MQFRTVTSGMRSRGFDSRYGSGQFGASRQSRGRRHPHQGLDISASPGELVFSPIDGEIVREAAPYAPFSGVLIQGRGDYAGYEVKLFYVDAFMCGSVTAGSVIGKAQDLSVSYPGIPNHVHMEVRHQGRLINPTEAYHMCF